MNKREEHNCRKAYLFREIAGQWLSLTGVRVKPSTAVKYRNILSNHLLPEFSEISVSEITTMQIEEFTIKKLENGKLDQSGGLSPKTVKDILSVLHEVLHYAEKRNFIVRCHVEDVAIKAPDTALQIISREEQRKLETYLFTHASLRNAGILLSLYTGIRIGELCALKWKHILPEDGLILIRGTMQRIQNFNPEKKRKTGVIITEPKSSASIRDIPLPAFLADLLKKYKNTSKEAFFLTGEEKTFLEPRTYQNYFKRILEINHIPNVNYHVLRHTFATRCVEQGFDLKSLSEILGHSSVNITLNRYVHASMEMKRRNMEKISALISMEEQAG